MRIARSNVLTTSAAMVVAGFVTTASAANITWNGGGAGDPTAFNNGLNWQGGTAPADLATAAGDLAILPSTVTVNQPTLTASQGVKGLQFDGAGWTLGGAASTLTVRGNSVSAGGNGIATTNASGLNVISSGVTISTNNSNVTAFDVATGGTLRLDGLVSNSGSGQIIKSGGGTLQFNLATTGSTGISNQLVISAGKVEALAGIGVRTGSGGGEVNILNGGTFDLVGVGASVKNIFLAAGGTLTSTSASTRTFTVSQQTANTDLAGLISGNLSLSLSGNSAPRAITISNSSNDFTGAMIVGDRTVITVSSLANGGVASAIGKSSNDATNLRFGGGFLRYIGTGVTIDRNYTVTKDNNTGGFESSGTGALVVTGDMTNTGNDNQFQRFVLGGTNTDANTISGLIRNGTGSKRTALDKVGVGTWILTNANTYTGTTVVGTSTATGGTLLINNATGSGTGTGAVSVVQGTLGGTGAMSGTVTVGDGAGADDASLSPGTIGTPIESLGTGALTFNSDGVLVAQIDSSLLTSDLVSATGAVALGSGIATLQLSDLGNAVLPNNAIFTLINSTIGVTGYFDGLAPVNGVGPQVVVGSNTYQLNYNPTSVTLSVVPEPTALALVGLSLIPVLRRRSR